MRYIWQHIETIISSYDGSTPLVHFLKAYYKQHPKLGSRDRKILNEMAYCWYRCSKGLPTEMPLQEKVIACAQLCNTQSPQLLRFLGDVTSGTEAYDTQSAFPHHTELSNGITKEEWLDSMLVQPRLFIRLRKDVDKVLNILDAEQIEYELIDEYCLSLPNGTPIDSILPEYTYVVQDASSQAVGKYFNPKPREEWWDTCSGAGGKSLFLLDKEPLINLTVADRRRSILVNLKERFRVYSHICPTIHKVDVAEADKLQAKLKDTTFDHIICDVPCSGSGTWTRTPEQYYFFSPESLAELNTLQRDITINAAGYLKKGGNLFYITCSVFKDENEGIVDAVVKETGLKVEEQKLINGTGYMADSMFITIFKK